MAEFQEVMSRKWEMCSRNKSCGECRLGRYRNEDETDCDTYVMTHPADAEAIIMNWVNGHTDELKRCNMCGKELDKFDIAENIFIERRCGYGSAHDFEKIHIDMCCRCFDHLIDACKLSPIVGVYG